MIIDYEILRPILLVNNPPDGCPMINFKSLLEFAHGYDTTGGFGDSTDLKDITCTPVHYACNCGIIHPSCRDCRVANTAIFDAGEYRRKLGLSY